MNKNLGVEKLLWFKGCSTIIRRLELLGVHSGGASVTLRLLPIIAAPFWKMGSKCFLSQVMLYTTGTNNLPREPGEGKSSRDKGSCLSVSSGGLNPITGFVLDSDQAICLALPLGKFEYGPLSWQGSWEIEKTVNKGVVKTLSKQKHQGREERTWWKEAGKKRKKKSKMKVLEIENLVF